MEHAQAITSWQKLEDSDHYRRDVALAEIIRVSQEMFKRIAARKSVKWGRDLLVSDPVNVILVNGMFSVYFGITCQQGWWSHVSGKNKPFVIISFIKARDDKNMLVQAVFRGENRMFPYVTPAIKGETIDEIEINTERVIFSPHMRGHLLHNRS